MKAARKAEAMNKVNFQRITDEVIKELENVGKRPELLLHSCCGPCSSYVLEYLSKYFKIKLFFYNPNIYPEEEYRKRLSEQKKLLSLMQPADTEIIEGSYEPDRFYEYVKGFEHEPEGGKRCELCIRMRMEAAAQEAKRQGADYFATTLTVSPHKNAVYINDAGKELESKSGIAYLVSDFKKRNGYKRSIELSREYNIYRQNYCGCVFSLDP